MDKQSIQQLREIPIEQVAERLGMELVRHKSLCPFHADHHPSLSFNVRKNTYRCFVCDAHGGTIDLVMHLLHKDFKEACSWLSNDSYETPTIIYNLSSINSTPPFDASKYEKYFDRPYLSPAAKAFLFDQRRLDPRVVRWCRLTSWRDRNGTDWLQIPYYDRDGRLVGIQNRNLQKGAQPRFRFPQGSECGIYNMPVLNRLHEGEPLYITEGASDCWAMLSAGHKAIAIPSATLLKPKDVRLLESLNRELETPFHMAPDRDAPGERLFLQLQKVLPNLEHHQLPKDCKDYADYYLQTKSLNFNR